MKLASFAADADLVGRRIRISWDFILEGAETLASIPRVTLRRKTRDFEFPPAAPGDPFLVYDSNAFPPAGATAADLPGWEERAGEFRIVYAVETVSRVVNGQAIETLRRTTATTLDDSGTPLKRHVEILDSGSFEEGADPSAARGLVPGKTYYYQIFSPLIAGETDVRRYRAVATAAQTHGMGRALYESLPNIHRRHDVQTRPPTPGAESVPEATPNAGQLRRFMDIFGVGLDYMRSGADGLLDIHDIDRVDYRYLSLMAQWIGWDLSHDASIPIQRHEIKYAAALYRLTGTIPGCMMWVKRLTGWDARIKEFYRNVFFTNNLGNPDDPTDRGSRTVDTSNPALMASVGKFEDDLDYVYDTGTTDEDWYAYNVVGIYVRPRPGESTQTIMRKKARLINNLSLFLPFNIRGVVILELDRTRDFRRTSVDFLRGAREDLS